MYKLAFATLLGVTLLTPIAAAAKRPMTLDDLFKFKRVSDPQVSPDGTQVVYTVAEIMDVAGNKTKSNLWLAATDGKTPPRQLTTTEKKDSHPRWSLDGKKILFQSNRSGDATQLWIIDLTGGEANQLTTISTGAETGIWSRDGKRIAFVSGVYAENSTKPFAESDKLNKEKAEKIEKNPVKAKVHTRLFYRHWDSYVEDKREHIFVMDIEEKAHGLQAVGSPRDVTPGDRDAYPTSTTFSVGDDFTFSPDGQFIVFTAVPAKGEAWSTNHDICRVSVNNTSTEWENLTKDNPAADCSPQFSPDGKMLAYRRQKKAGYEADKWELCVVACDLAGNSVGSARSITAQFDRSVDEFCWTKSHGLVFVCDEAASKPLYFVSVNDTVGPVRLPVEGMCGSPSCGNQMGMAFTNARLTRPAEIFGNVSSGPEVFNISKANDALLAEMDLSRPESVTVKGANVDPMQMWILKPPGFDASKKWPVAYLVHGGPQGAWEDGWSFRWCPELWAAQGYVVALPNPRGSTGFGQKYVDEITGDWGGKCYEDLMKGADYIESLPYVDKNRIGAAGASFGGYMMDWFATQTPRFKCLISHCSVYNFESEYTTTDELWFDEWEHGGPPWGKNRESYEKHSPHRFAANLGKFKTPMLLIQNDLDFRCPVGQGIELFSALQRQGVPSKLINFPDEGHWVLKPANSKFWHEEVFAWMTKYVPPGGK
jgi:dipeptidyl aminopeptidase/acylaminoacyl peptidase